MTKDSQLESDVDYLRSKKDPRLDDIANQLSQAQEEGEKLRAELAETSRPLDEQMKRLNQRVMRLRDALNIARMALEQGAALDGRVAARGPMVRSVIDSALESLKG